MSKYHIPVLLKESVKALNLKEGGVYVDATFGGGGHSVEILNSGITLTLFAFDQDNDAAKLGEEFEKKYRNFTFIKDNFKNLRTGLALNRIKKIDGILFDLGVSSHQIDSPDRGFSFMKEGKLDMRMNTDSDLTAEKIINTFSKEQLQDIFIKFGEEREAFRIASAIVKERQKKTITTTTELSEIIDKSIKSHHRIKAKARIFQAIRIYINREIDALSIALKDAVHLLNKGGRIAVISYHSLEDRVVKQFFKYENLSCICPDDFPVCVCNKVSTLDILTKKPILPDVEEVKANPRAKSAKLRIAERK